MSKLYKIIFDCVGILMLVLKSLCSSSDLFKNQSLWSEDNRYTKIKQLK